MVFRLLCIPVGICMIPMAMYLFLALTYSIRRLCLHDEEVTGNTLFRAWSFTAMFGFSAAFWAMLPLLYYCFA